MNSRIKTDGKSGIDRVKLREVAQKFVDENFNIVEPTDIFIVENAMMTGINFYLESQKNESKEEEGD